MGQLLYGAPSESFEFEDRMLAHLEIVIVAKLRRQESFSLSVVDDKGGRVSIWINPSSILQFRYKVAAHEINRAWLEELVDSANTPAGLRPTPEPAD